MTSHIVKGTFCEFKAFIVFYQWLQCKSYPPLWTGEILKDVNFTVFISDWYSSHNLLTKHWEVSESKGEKVSHTESHNSRKNPKAGSYSNEKQLKHSSRKRRQHITDILCLNEPANSVFGIGEGRKERQHLLANRSTKARLFWDILVETCLGKNEWTIWKRCSAFFFPGTTFFIW